MSSSVDLPHVGSTSILWATHRLTMRDHRNSAPVEDHRRGLDVLVECLGGVDQAPRYILSSMKRHSDIQHDSVGCWNPARGPCLQPRAHHRCDRRHAQNLKSAVGSVHLSNEGAEPIDVLAWPLAHFPAKAEVLPFRRNHQRPYIAAACFVDSVSQTMRELQIKSVVRRIGK